MAPIAVAWAKTNTSHQPMTGSRTSYVDSGISMCWTTGRISHHMSGGDLPVSPSTERNRDMPPPTRSRPVGVGILERGRSPRKCGPVGSGRMKRSFLLGVSSDPSSRVPLSRLGSLPCGFRQRGTKLMAALRHHGAEVTIGLVFGRAVGGFMTLWGINNRSHACLGSLGALLANV